MSFILEQYFYNKTKGFPLEEPKFAMFSFGCNHNEYDSFGIITNSFPMYVRVFPLRGGCQDGHCISKEGRYANLDSETRNKECPKIAWGFSAFLFCHLSVMIDGETYNRNYHNYIISNADDVNYHINETTVKDNYLSIIWNDYNKLHSGIKFRDVSEKSKCITFLKQHHKDERIFWKRTKPILKEYLCSSVNQKAGKLLYDYIEVITKQYRKEIKKRLNHIQYKWFYQAIRFIKKHIIKIASGFCVALIAYICKDFAVMLYQYICKLIINF